MGTVKSMPTVLWGHRGQQSRRGGLAEEASPLAGPVSAPHEGGPTQQEALGGESTQHRAQHMVGGQ